MEGRCGCREPCLRTRIDLVRWDQSPSDFGRGYATNNIQFHFARDFKVYVFQTVYTMDHLLADVGGYLGLFLGLSCFGLVELLETAVNFHARTASKRKMAVVRGRQKHFQQTH